MGIALSEEELLSWLKGAEKFDKITYFVGHLGEDCGHMKPMAVNIRRLTQKLYFESKITLCQGVHYRSSWKRPGNTQFVYYAVKL
jgi:hypothetical protein